MTEERKRTSIRIQASTLEAIQNYVEEERGEGQFSAFVEDLFSAFLNAESEGEFEELGLSIDELDELRSTVETMESDIDSIEEKLKEENFVEETTDEQGSFFFRDS